MTIGIAVFGPDAARAALAGLQAVEAVGRGAIGGFVSLSALLPDRRLVNLDTQRGGAGALLNTPGLGRLDAARHAVLMSSGPDRPEPLSQFTPADPAAGMVTGHRLPNMPGPNGMPPNVVTLRAMAGGAAPQEAIDAALSGAPDLDAGLIAMNLDGEIALANAASVAARDDIGAALVAEAVPRVSIGVLHNSIFPHRGLAELAASAILDHIAPQDAFTRSGEILGLEVRPADCSRALLVDPARLHPVAFLSADPDWRRAEWEGCPVRRGDPVTTGDRVIGRVIGEAYCILRAGTVIGARGGSRVCWIESEVR